MSEESPAKLPDSDPAARVGAELRARLRNLPPDELVEMAAQLVTTYVVEGVLPLSRAGEGADLAADSGGEETFAQMLKRLKVQRRDPVLDRFLIDGENISVRIEGQGVVPLTEYRRPTTAPAAPAGAGVSVQITTTARQPTAPGAATSIYNRSLYQAEAAPPTRGNPAPIQPPALQQAAQRPAAPPGQPGAAPKKDEGKEAKDRFALIELD